MMSKRRFKGPLDLSHIDQRESVRPLRVTAFTDPVVHQPAPEKKIPSGVLLKECLAWFIAWGKYIKKDLRQGLRNMRSMATDIIGATGQLPQTQKVFFATGMIMLFVTVSLVRGVVLAQRFESQLGVLGKDVSEVQLPQLAQGIMRGDLRGIMSQVEQMRVMLQEVKGELPNLVTSSTNIGSTNAKVLQVMEAYDHLAVSSMALLQTGDSIKEFVSDIQQMPQDQLRSKYKSITTYFSYQWEGVMSNVVPNMRLALAQIYEVDMRYLPSHIKKNTEQVAYYVEEFLRIVDVVEENKDAILTMLGDDGPRHYVVLLQNTGEARATGGFFGTMMFIKVNSGYIEDLYIEDTYAIDGQILQSLDVPKGLSDFQYELRLRDANYWPDFPTSAKQIAWFLDKHRGPSIDGVFAVTDRAAEKVLSYVPDLQLQGKTVSSEDFLTVLSALIEAKVDKKDPKSFLKNMMSDLPGQLMTAMIGNPMGMLEMLDAIETKQVMAFAFDTNVQDFFDRVSLSGRIGRPGEKDAFLYVPTSVSGNKSDHYISRYITHHTVVSKEYTRDTVSLTKQHLWNDETATYLKDLLGTYGLDLPPELLTILGAGENKEYVRYYVPKGSKLISSSGIALEEIDTSEDLGFTVFGFRSDVLAGQRQKVVLEYELPNVIKGDYALSLLHSPGSAAIPMQKSIANDTTDKVYVKNILLDRDIDLGQFD